VKKKYENSSGNQKLYIEELQILQWLIKEKGQTVIFITLLRASRTSQKSGG
jgi:hypothetical protein